MILIHNYLRLDHYTDAHLLIIHPNLSSLKWSIYTSLCILSIPAPLSFFPIAIAWVKPCAGFSPHILPSFPCCFALSCLSHLIRSLVCPPIAALFCMCERLLLSEVGWISISSAGMACWMRPLLSAQRAASFSEHVCFFLPGPSR